MKTKCLIYCTKGKNNKEKLHRCLDEEWRLQDNNDGWVFSKDSIHFDGKIVAECEVETEKIECRFEDDDYGGDYVYSLEKSEDVDFSVESCLDFDELNDYLKGENGYASHISDLNVFDKPLELSSNELLVKSYKYDNCHYLKRAPMNMCWVFHNGEWKVLISIRPEWVCKILNGEKKIEVRRKVLKGMVE